jgi:hypothetical protein
MRYAILNLKFKSTNASILDVLIFERKEKNTFGLMFNRSKKKSIHYEKQLLQIIDGKYNFTSINNDNTDVTSFNFKYPFENIKKYVDSFTFTPISMVYEEKQVNSVNDAISLINKFSMNEEEEIGFIDSFNYGSLISRNNLNITISTDTVNIKNKIQTYLTNDIKTVTLTVENIYKSIGLSTIPVTLINKLNDLINNLVDSSSIPESQLSKVNLAFINNCVKTVIHLPKTEPVKAKVNHFRNSINKIKTNDVEVNIDNQNIYSNIIELLDNASIDELKIEIDDLTYEINEKESKELSQKVQSFKKNTRDSFKSNFSKLIIPYEYNTYSNSFMGIDKDLNIHVYYVDNEILDQLWVLKNKIIETNAREVLEQLENGEINFNDFRNNIIKIEGKYRSKSSADVNNIIYIIASDIR